jgi:methionyl-tRNA synthetase
MSRYTVTNAIPYVNGDPHLGHALEFVQADVLARHRRLRGDEVRAISGTDDNALKNAAAAEREGVPVADFVAAKAARFEQLREPLALSYDDFIRTSTDPRHRPGVERLWRACRDRGDLELREYVGRYCAGCEAFLGDDDLSGGLCPEHGVAPERVAERNWFFRLSRYERPLRAALESGAIRIEPEHRRNEVLAFVRSGLSDLSVSRSRERARGWGIPVPDDPGQVIYVWFDALANYITALGYGTADPAYAKWWSGASERVHVVGKGITRFHAVYWPAILLSAGEPLPTRIDVHDYLTIEGQKIGKSLGNAVSPESLVERFGTDALRWWLLRDVPRSGDADFRPEQLARRANELADGLGNLVSRVVTLVARHRPDGVDHSVAGGPGGASLRRSVERVAEDVDAGLDRFDLRAATGAVWDVVTQANAYLSAARPWEIPRTEGPDARSLDVVLALLLDACSVTATELRPFLPGGAARIHDALGSADPSLARRLFRKFDAEAA